MGASAKAEASWAPRRPPTWWFLGLAFLLHVPRCQCEVVAVQGSGCPSPTSPWSTTTCCCGSQCCWDKCKWSDPPVEGCLIGQAAKAQWTWSTDDGFYKAIFPQASGVIDCGAAEREGTKTSLGPHDNDYEAFEYINGSYLINASLNHRKVDASNPPQGDTFLCSVYATGGWGVAQAHCCDCDAPDPLSATRTKMFGRSGWGNGYSCYYGCVRVECQAQANTCTCAAGTAATGAACTEDGAEICAACGAGHQLAGNACQESAELELAPQALVEQVRTQELALVEDAVITNQTKITKRVGKTTTSIRYLLPGEIDRVKSGLIDEVEVEVDATEVVVPASVFAQLGAEADGGVVIVITTFDPESIPGHGSNGSPGSEEEGESEKARQAVEVRAATNINLVAASGGGYLAVGGLAEPIRVSLPVESAAGVECAYWDEARSAWSTEGLAVGEDGREDGTLVCETRHLSLFAGIARGFVNNFVCSQVSLLTADAIVEITKGDWWRSWGAGFLWGHLGAFFLLMLAALALDRRRSREGSVADEHFLIPLQEEEQQQPPGENDDDPADGTRSEEEKRPRFLSCLWCVCCAYLCCCCTYLASWARSSSMLRDALDEVMSNWCEYFSDVRSSLESVWEGVEPDAEGDGTAEEGRGMRLAMRVTQALVASSARRSAGASAWISQETVSLLMEDEDLSELLLGSMSTGVVAERENSKPDVGPEESGQELAAEPTGSGPALPCWLPACGFCTPSTKRDTGVADDDVAVEPSSTRDGCEAAPVVTGSSEPVRLTGSSEPVHFTGSMRSMCTMAREESWHKVRKPVADTLNVHIMRSAQCASLPRVFFRIFLVQNPFGAALVHCNCISSALRTLFFMADICGALMLDCLFFEATGGVKNKKSRAHLAGCSSDEIGDKIGRLLGVGVASMVLATIPAMLLGALHSRSFKKFECEGCPEWRRQLRNWRIQDRIIWVIGVPYCGFCIFFILIFLANVTEEDLSEWVITGTISVVQDVLIFPLCVSLFVPLFSMSAISLASCVKKVQKKDLVEEIQSKVLRVASLRGAP